MPRARRNPRGPEVTLVAVAFRRHPAFLRELRAAKTKPTLDQAARLLSDMSGRPYTQVREGALLTLATALERAANNPEQALSFLSERNPRIGVWCACALADSVVRLVPNRMQHDAWALIRDAQTWAGGKALASNAKKRASELFDAAADERNEAAEYAMKACATLYEAVKNAESTWAVASFVTSANDANEDGVTRADYFAILSKAIVSFPSTL